MIDSSQSTSTRPYLLRALYEWCADNSLTPYVAAFVDDTVKVPREHVKNNEIVLNISMDATSNLQIGNDFLQFKARFGGVAREIVVPIDHIIAIYARENGQGMAFPVPQAMQPVGDVAQKSPSSTKPAQSLRSVQSTAADAGAQEQTAATKIVKLKAQETGTPLLQPFISVDSAPALSTEAQSPQDDPPPPGAPGGQTKGAGRPALTRIK